MKSSTLKTFHKSSHGTSTLYKNKNDFRLLKIENSNKTPNVNINNSTFPSSSLSSSSSSSSWSSSSILTNDSALLNSNCSSDEGFSEYSSINNSINQNYKLNLSQYILHNFYYYIKKNMIYYLMMKRNHKGNIYIFIFLMYLFKLK